VADSNTYVNVNFYTLRQKMDKTGSQYLTSMGLDRFIYLFIYYRIQQGIWFTGSAVNAKKKKKIGNSYSVKLWHPLVCCIIGSEFWICERQFLILYYTGWSKSLCATNNYSINIRCTETFWSPCIWLKANY